MCCLTLVARTKASELRCRRLVGNVKCFFSTFPPAGECRDGSRSRVGAAGASGWALRHVVGGEVEHPVQCRAIATANWTATERAPHQRVAQPEDTAARSARSRTRSRTKHCAAVASDLGAQDQKLLQAAPCEFGVGAARSVHLNGARMRVTRSFFFSRAFLKASNVSTQVLVPMRPTL